MADDRVIIRPSAAEPGRAAKEVVILSFQHLRELHYRTDFNNLRGDGLLTALLGFGGSIEPPSPGERVRLFDGDGNSCGAFAMRFEHDLVWAKPDWSTWIPAVHVENPVVELMEALRASVAQAQRAPRIRAGDQEQRETSGDDFIFDVKQSA